MAVEFEITDRKVDDETHVIAVAGEIDLFTAPEFKQRMSQLIDAGRSRLVVDLSETSFIDSSSLGVLIGAHRRLKQRDGRLVVVCDNDAIVKTFKITGLDGVFTLVRSLDDAVLVADLIAARAPAHVAGSRVDVALEPGARSLSLRVGPLREGGGQALIIDAAVPGVGNVIEQLADELTVSPEDSGEYLHVRLAYAATTA